MSEQRRNIIWMAEELDFELPPDTVAQTELEINAFLESAANKSLNHTVYQAWPESA